MSEPSTAAHLAARAERLEDLRDVIGEPRPGSAIVPERVWTTLEARYERVVGPLIERTWPPEVDPENREHFLSKSRFIARRYASLAYVPVALAATSPLRSLPLAGALQRLTLGTALGVAEPLVTRASAALVPALLAAAPIDARTADLLAGLCTAYDQQFDDWPGDADPVERHRHIERLFRDPGELTRPAPSPPRPRSPGRSWSSSRRASATATTELAELGCEASAAEMRVESGEPDPESLSHRRAAAEGTVDAMMLQTESVPPEVRDWMRDLAVFTQLTDDWVDAETDMEMRETPVLTGAVGLADIEARWAELLADSGSMLRACGIERAAGRGARRGRGPLRALVGHRGHGPPHRGLTPATTGRQVDHVGPVGAHAPLEHVDVGVARVLEPAPALDLEPAGGPLAERVPGLHDLRLEGGAAPFLRALRVPGGGEEEGRGGPGEVLARRSPRIPPSG